MVKIVQCKCDRRAMEEKRKQIDVWFKELLIGRDPVFQIHKEGRRNREVLTRRKGALVEVVRVGEVGGFHG